MLRGLPKGFVKEGLGPFLVMARGSGQQVRLSRCHRWHGWELSRSILSFGICLTFMNWLCNLPHGTGFNMPVSSGRALSFGGRFFEPRPKWARWVFIPY